MTATLRQRCSALIEELGLGASGALDEVTPLTGGVASDIARVRLGTRVICVKFALPKLKVAEDWHAPVHRNGAEYAWLEVAADLLPETAVKLFGRSEALHGFAMEFLAGDDVTLWKATLLAETPMQGEAARVGGALGRIHAGSTRPGFDPAPFHNRDDFRALRIDPYLGFTARRHPAVAGPLGALAAMLYAGDRVLVHGDVSPKNILFRGAHPVLLDAECATMGDASFDPAFCLNHLILKAIHLPRSRGALLAAASAFWTAYAAAVDWEDLPALEARVAALVPALMLARVDGKSPVEYLDESEQDIIRALAIRQIRDPEATVAALAGRIPLELEDIGA